MRFAAWADGARRRRKEFDVGAMRAWGGRVRNTLKSLVWQHYPEVAAELLEPLLAVLQLARQYCGGDTDKFLVMMVVALRTTQHPDFRALSAEGPVNERSEVLPSLGVNGQSIADSLGIPKETVRRKVRDLIDAGWIVRMDGGLHFTAQAYRDLTPVREELAALAASYHEVVAGLRARA
jgi:hypothetical protein